MPCHCHRAERVADIVVAGHRQSAAFDHPPLGLKRHVEMRDTFFVVQIDRPHIGLRVKSVGHNSAVSDAPHKGLNLGVICAADRQPVKRNIADKVVEPLPQALDIAPMLHVLGVDIGDDGDGRGQTVESAIALVGLDHHPLALPHARIAAIGVNDAAVDDRGIDPPLDQKLGHKRRGRGLAMSARHSDVGLEAHQLGQHLGPAHHRQTALARLVQFRIAGLDRRRDHDHLRTSEVLGALPLENCRPDARQTLGNRRGFEIRTLHPVAMVDQHFGNSRHADPPDSDEVDGTDIRRKLGRCVHCFCPFCARSSTISARFWGASGIPQLSAACAIIDAPVGSASTAPICSVSTASVNRLSGITIAPPAAASPRALAA